MTSIKLMLTGIMLALAGVFFAALDGGRGDAAGAGIGFAFLGLGIVVFLAAIIYDLIKHDWSNSRKF